MGHDEDTRARWVSELEARARAYWTEARTDELLRGKNVAIRPAEAAVLLRAIGLVNGDATMPPAQVRKYLQINHMVGMLKPAFEQLAARHERVVLLDAGCGRSYLSLLLAWCGKHVWGQRIEVVGVDRNADVIEECRRRAAIARLDDLARFEAKQLEDVEAGSYQVVLALHACDTATCDAIALGVGLGAELIAVAPCCQAELARGWAALAESATSRHGGAPPRDGGDAGAARAAGGFATIWRTPHLRRETAAHVTDAMRAALLRAAGYDVAAIEFVPSEHTRKNTLIRAHRPASPHPAAARAAARAEHDALVATTGGVALALAGRI